MSDVKDTFKEYYSDLLRGTRDASTIATINKVSNGLRLTTLRAIAKFPHTAALTKEVRKIKEEAVAQLDQLVEQASNSLTENGAHVFYARSAKDALEYASRVVGTGKICMFGKSGTSEEIGLRTHLEELGNECWETDVGEVIAQIRKERPVYSLGPAIHIPHQEIAKSLSSFLGREVPPDIPTEVAAIRSFLHDKYRKANVGITGCNVLAADTGSLLLIENEGNIHISTGLPSIHIAIVGIEKIVPSLQHAFKVAEVQWRYTGYNVPAYMSMISAPSNTGDIELTVTRGASGPTQLHVVLLDNGRISLAKEPILREALYCIRCGGGGCVTQCPVYLNTSGYYGYKYQGGLGAIWTAYLVGGLARAVPIAYTCLRCGRCVESCPINVDIPKLIVEFRKIVVSQSAK